MLTKREQISRLYDFLHDFNIFVSFLFSKLNGHINLTCNKKFSFEVLEHLQCENLNYHYTEVDE